LCTHGSPLWKKGLGDGFAPLREEGALQLAESLSSY